MSRLADREQQRLAQRFRALWQCYREQQDLINIGAYRPGSDPLTDEAIARYDAMRSFISQAADEAVGAEDARRQLDSVFKQVQ